MTTTTPSVSPLSFSAQWWHHVRNASAGYWLAQALMLTLFLGLSAFLLVGLKPVEVTNAPDRLHLLQRLCTDGLLLIAPLHLVVRPALLMYVVNRRFTWRTLVVGLAALGVLGFLNVLASMWLGKLLTPRDGMNFDQIRFHAGDSVYDFGMGTQQMLLLGSFNQASLLLLWSLLYLAWKAFESRRQLQQQVRQARLRQLTHQLSPHFLFNAFNSIRGMIFEDRERAALLVTQLSELFRFHLASDVRTDATVSEDWDIARRYLDIEAVRLEERLRISAELDPALAEHSLPTLTLLTLVENAIKHGIAPNREGGWLMVRSQAAGADHWQLEVENSVGRGEAEYRGGHGLANLRERLHLTFGERAHMHVIQDEARFLVRMEIPR